MSGISDHHIAQSRNRVSLCFYNSHSLEISAGTIHNQQMTQCRIDRYRQGEQNSLGRNFVKHVTVVHANVEDERTDLYIQMTSFCDENIPLMIRRNGRNGVIDIVSIGQNCQKRWDFRRRVLPAMHGMYFDIRHALTRSHITTLVIMLRGDVAHMDWEQMEMGNNTNNIAHIDSEQREMENDTYTH